MTDPNKTQAPSRFTAGAVDLGAVKARAEQQAKDTSEGISPVVDVTAANLEAEVLVRSTQVPVVLLLGSARSEASEQVRSVLAELARAAGLRWIFAYADVEQTPELAQAFGIQALPTVVALGQGQPLASFEGEQPREVVEQWIAKIVAALDGRLQGLPEGAREGGEGENATEDPRLTAVAEQLERGEYDAAISALDAILAAEPANEDAKAARDNARLAARLAQADPDADPVAAADADPQDQDKAFAAADHQIAAGDVEQALDRLIALLPNKDVQARLLELFALFDAGDPRIIAARGKMASRLY